MTSRRLRERWPTSREWDAKVEAGINALHQLVDVLGVVVSGYAGLYLLPQQLVGVVLRRVCSLMAGKVTGFLRGLKQVLTKRKKTLKKAKREVLASIIGYFERNAARMPYKDFFEAGYPFASGSVEGACRHLVADRMEGTGMRWKMPGAQAVLHLRSVDLNDERADFQAYQVRREQERLYGVKPRSQATA